MKSRKAAKRRRPSRSMLFRLAVAAFAVYAGVSILSLQTEVAQSRKKLEALEALKKAQGAENTELQMQLGMGDDEEYIVNMARENLDFVYPYETVFINASGN